MRWRGLASIAAAGLFALGLCCSLLRSSPVALVGAGQVVGRLREMNRKLSAENSQLHNLLRQDESANMRVEAGLQVSDAIASHVSPAR